MTSDVTDLPTVPGTLARTAQKYPEREAIVYPRKNTRLTYEDLDRRVTRCANALNDLGVESDDRVSLLAHNSAEFIVAMFGLLRTGAVFNPINYRLAPNEVGYILNDADSSVLLFEEATRETVETGRDQFGTVDRYLYIDDDIKSTPEYAMGFHDAVSAASDNPIDASVAPTDQYAIMYTSGTTGRPKGVVHSHSDATYHSMMYFGRMDLDYTDIGVSAMPLYHNAELNCGLCPRLNLGGENGSSPPIRPGSDTGSSGSRAGDAFVRRL